jgi:hypothetical protein
MTVEEFKENNPNLAHLQGEDLLDAMTHSMLRQQQADQIIKQIKPIWKTHTLRWLFYRRKPNWVMGKNGWASSKMCDKCKKGVDS